MAESGKDASPSPATTPKMTRPNPSPAARRDTQFFLSRGVSMAAVKQEKGDVSRRKGIFALLCIMQLFANFDAGVIPSALTVIQDEFGLDFVQAGSLGSLVYVGLVISCPITGFALTKMASQRKILIVSLTLNVTALLLFVLVPNQTLLLFTRLLTGISQAPLFVYPPVWVDEFAPETSLTVWVSVLQSMTALGIMVGYMVTSAAMNSMDPKQGWRIAIYIQVAVLAPFVVLFSCLRGRLFNALGGKEARLMDQTAKISKKQAKKRRAQRKRQREAMGLSGNDQLRNSTLSDVDADDAAPANEGPSLGSQLCALFNRPVYLWIILGLSGLYFVVTGIQFWVTDYMIRELKVDQLSVQVAFGLTSLTGPLCGVFFGGWLVDKMGGYKATSKATENTLLTCNVFGVGAVLFAIPAAFVRNFYGAIICIWFVLFFGGALLPALTGVCLTAVPENSRSLASSFSMFTYNILGYAAAPLVCGMIAQNASLAVGFQFVMLTSCVAILATLGAYCSQRRISAREGPAHDNLEEAAAGAEANESKVGEAGNRRPSLSDASAGGRRQRAPTMNDYIGLVSTAAARSRCSLAITDLNFFGNVERIDPTAQFSTMGGRARFASQAVDFDADIIQEVDEEDEEDEEEGGSNAWDSGIISPPPKAQRRFTAEQQEYL